MADTKNRTDARRRVRFLPRREESNPENMPPIIHPISALEIVAPWIQELNPWLVIR
jgi:hypothetical protein